MIKNLIRLDFYALKPLAPLLLLFLIVPITLGLVTQPQTSILVSLTFIVYVLNIVFSLTEKNHFYLLYGTLPIKRSAPILSRYLFSCIVLFLTAFVSFALYLVLSLVINGTFDFSNGLFSLSASFLLAAFFISIQYPFYFRFDYLKAAILSILPYVLFFALGVPLGELLLKKTTVLVAVMDKINYLHAHPVIFSFVGTLVSLLLLSGSCGLSVRLKKTDS